MPSCTAGDRQTLQSSMPKFVMGVTAGGGGGNDTTNEADMGVVVCAGRVEFGRQVDRIGGVTGQIDRDEGPRNNSRKGRQAQSKPNVENPNVNATSRTAVRLLQRCKIP